jgi:hypothetical protein
MGRRVGSGAIDHARAALLVAREALVEALGRVDAAVQAIDGLKHLSKMSTREAILAYMRQVGIDQKPAEVADALRLANHAVTNEAVNQAMYRMARRGTLAFASQGRYKLSTDTEPSPTEAEAEHHEPE